MDYKVNNIDSVITKINRRWLKNALPLKSFFTFPVMNICGVSSCEILATWGQTERPALVKLKKNGGNVIYFSGILAGTNNDFLRYVLSFLESKNNVFYPLIPKNKKCCVSLFYDYEGRYGNSKYGEYTKKGLGYMLSTHRKYNIKATFNVVGKISEVFPQSIKDIVNDGHEIASHTYEHVVPRSAGYKTLNDSIKKSIEVSKSAFGENLRGFRSPKSQWNANLVSILEDYKFHWNAEDEAASLPYYMVLNKRLSLIRIPITCDDFPYISESYSGDYMLAKFKKAIEEGIRTNSFVAIGFHPWIEGMREENLHAFERFLSLIASNNDLSVMTFGEIAGWWRQRNSKQTL